MAFVLLDENAYEGLAKALPPLRSQDGKGGLEYHIAYAHLRGFGIDCYLTELDVSQRRAFGFLWRGDRREGRMAYVNINSMIAQNALPESSEKVEIESPWPARSLGHIAHWCIWRGSWHGDGVTRYANWVCNNRVSKMGFEVQDNNIVCFVPKDEGNPPKLSDIRARSGEFSFEGYKEPKIYKIDSQNRIDDMSLCEALVQGVASDGSISNRIGDIHIIRRGTRVRAYFCDNVGFKDISYEVFAGT